MAIVVSDNFNRANDSSTIGTATTGQVWANVPQAGGQGDPFGILSNQAYWNRNGSGTGDGLAALETGLGNAVVSVKLMDVTAGGGLNLRNMGILFRYVDTTHYLFATYSAAGGGLWRLYVTDGSGGPIHLGPDSAAHPVNGDTMKVAFCGQQVTILLNDVVAEGYPITFGTGLLPALSSTLLAGTKCGLQANGGVISFPPYQIFDDFLVETNSECEGAEWELPPLEWSAEGIISPLSFGSTTTKRFDAGTGNTYYLIPQLSDSGIELRDKVIKAVRITGKFNAANFKLYAYGATEGINLSDLELGLNSKTGAVAIPNSTLVTQTRRFQVNVSGAALHTIRIEGTWAGEGIKDRIDEIVYEIAEMGARR